MTALQSLLCRCMDNIQDSQATSNQVCNNPACIYRTVIKNSSDTLSRRHFKARHRPCGSALCEQCSMNPLAPFHNSLHAPSLTALHQHGREIKRSTPSRRLQLNLLHQREDEKTSSKEYPSQQSSQMRKQSKLHVETIDPFMQPARAFFCDRPRSNNEFGTFRTLSECDV